MKTYTIYFAIDVMENFENFPVLSRRWCFEPRTFKFKHKHSRIQIMGLIQAPVRSIDEQTNLPHFVYPTCRMTIHLSLSNERIAESNVNQDGTVKCLKWSWKFNSSVFVGIVHISKWNKTLNNRDTPMTIENFNSKIVFFFYQEALLLFVFTKPIDKQKTQFLNEFLLCHHLHVNQNQNDKNIWQRASE